MVDCGFHVLALPEVIESKELKGSRVKAIKTGSGYLLGGFRVIPFLLSMMYLVLAISLSTRIVVVLCF